jgi:hypothetical protein
MENWRPWILVAALLGGPYLAFVAVDWLLEAAGVSAHWFFAAVAAIGGTWAIAAWMGRG